VFSIMSIGFAWGTSFGAILGASLLILATQLAQSSLSLWSGLAPWQVVLVLVAIPGVLLALVMASVPEPRRRGLLPGARSTVLPLREVYAYFRVHDRAYLPMFAAMGIKAMLSFGSGLWVPELFRRTHGWAPTRTALLAGFLGIVVAPLGLLAGSWLATRFARAGRDDANLRVLQIATVAVLPFSVAYPLATSPDLALALWALNYFCAMLGVGPANAALQMITPTRCAGRSGPPTSSCSTSSVSVPGPSWWPCSPTTCSATTRRCAIAGVGGRHRRAAGDPVDLVRHETLCRLRGAVAHLDLNRRTP
jgi:hypothetical protein